MRMKKTYSIKVETAESIKKIADQNAIPESYAVDMIVSSFMRHIAKKAKKTNQDQSSEEWYETYWNDIVKDGSK